MSIISILCRSVDAKNILFRQTAAGAAWREIVLLGVEDDESRRAEALER